MSDHEARLLLSGIFGAVLTGFLVLGLWAVFAPELLAQAFVNVIRCVVSFVWYGIVGLVTACLVMWLRS